MMRTMLYEAAQIKAWAIKIARHRGMKKAIVALARRLAVIMHRMDQGGRRKEPYGIKSDRRKT
jgi:hypothetical protein